MCLFIQGWDSFCILVIAVENNKTFIKFVAPFPNSYIEEWWIHLSSGDTTSHIFLPTFGKSLRNDPRSEKEFSTAWFLPWKLATIDVAICQYFGLCLPNVLFAFWKVKDAPTTSREMISFAHFPSLHFSICHCNALAMPSLQSWNNG